MEDSIKKNEGKQYNKDDNILEPNDNLCCICYNKHLTLFLNCNHIICLECITNIKKLCCPLCRTNLSYLPKKIIKIINNDGVGTGTSNNYLSLLQNVHPLSLSSNIDLSPLSINSNLQSLSLSTLPLSTLPLYDLHHNNISIYEQYFNEQSFIDIDDIIHYGFVIGNGDGSDNRDGSNNGGSDNSDGSNNGDGSDRGNRNRSDNYRYSGYFDRADSDSNSGDGGDGGDDGNDGDGGDGGDGGGGDGDDNNS